MTRYRIVWQPRAGGPMHQDRYTYHSCAVAAAIAAQCNAQYPEYMHWVEPVAEAPAEREVRHA